MMNTPDYTDNDLTGEKEMPFQVMAVDEQQSINQANDQVMNSRERFNNIDFKLQLPD